MIRPGGHNVSCIRFILRVNYYIFILYYEHLSEHIWLNPGSIFDYSRPGIRLRYPRTSAGTCQSSVLHRGAKRYFPATWGGWNWENHNFAPAHEPLAVRTKTFRPSPYHGPFV